MRKSKSAVIQIIAILKSAGAGAEVADLAGERGASAATIYAWRTKYGGMDASEAKRRKELEGENRRFKEMVAELSLNERALNFAFGRMW